MENITCREDLKSGYVVELRSGKKMLVTRAGSFTKILLDPRTGEWCYLNSYYNDRFDRVSNPSIRQSSNEYRLGKREDIMIVYGLVQGTVHYDECFTTSTSCRKIVWSRIPPVRMTQEEIEAELGYRIEIVGDENG